MATPFMPTDVEPAVSEISHRRVLKSGMVVAAGLIAAQLAGFLRQATLGYLLGTGPEADAFSAAMAPIELWWSVLGLAVIFGFAPKMSESGAMGGYSFWDIFRPVSHLALGSTAALLIFANPIVQLFAPGMSPEAASLSAGLLRALALAPAAIGCSFVFSALLFSRRAFLLPSIHNAVVNVATIIGALLLHREIGVFGFAVGYTVGAWLHLVIVYLASKPHLLAHAPTQSGRSRPINIWTLLSGPGPILGQALAMELNTAVSRAYASTFGLGMTAAFDYGFKLFRVPLALLVIPLSQSLLPEISSLEASPTRRRSAGRAMQRAAVVTLAASATMMVLIMLLHDDLVAILFERGEFGQSSTVAVATVLLGYMPVILGRGMVDLLSRTLFSLGEYRAPLLAAGLALALNAAVCAVLPSFEPRLIGLGAILGFSVGGWLITRHVWRMRSDG
jgi:putative peptidoglycan lipid II flippase